MKLDSNRLIWAGTDLGDVCHRQYTALLRLKLLSDTPDYWKNDAFNIRMNIAGPVDSQRLLEIEPGIYVRHPDPLSWVSDPRNVSRDQLTPVICFHTLESYTNSRLTRNLLRREQQELLKACLKRYMFAQNIYPNWVDPRKETVKAKTADFITPDLWAVFARAWLKTVWAPLALPVVLFGDFCLIITVLLKVFAPITKDTNDGKFEFRWPGPDDVDDDNINNVLMTTQHAFPTPFSWLARKIYKTFRRKNLGNTELGEKDAVMGALAQYHRNDNPELAEIARPLVNKY